MPVFQLSDQMVFPPVHLAEESGLLAIGGDLQPKRLIAAYSRGIFPWYSEGDPLLWWFTSPRLVLFINELRVPKRLKRTMRKRPFEITYDQDFDGVISNCAKLRIDQGGETWIVPEMLEAYNILYELGFAHSVECWQDGSLAGGLYGVRLDGVFFGESMFSRVSDASKIALVSLVETLAAQGVKVIDCQMTTKHLLQFGAREIEGKTFQKLLRRLIKSTTPDGRWDNG